MWVPGFIFQKIEGFLGLEEYFKISDVAEYSLGICPASLKYGINYCMTCLLGQTSMYDCFTLIFKLLWCIKF